MNRRWPSLAGGLVALAALPLLAAPNDPPPAPDRESLREHIRKQVEQALEPVRALRERLPLELAQAGLEPPAFAFVRGELGAGREIVKNAPYTAEAVTETVQTLADGNRIVRRSTLQLARDSFGRTRQEHRGAGGSRAYIHDPIEGRSFVLNAERRSVTQIPRAPMPAESPAAPGAAPPVPPRPTAAREGEGGSRRVFVTRRGGEGSQAENVHVEVVRIGGPGAHDDLRWEMAPQPPFAPRPHGKGETKSLGTRDFDGVRAEGTQTTHTIPAGQIGNEKPIVVTSERWFSPELHIVVLSRTTDPRAGETSYRVANLKRAEPAPELFKVPADYRARGAAAD